MKKIFFLLCSLPIAVVIYAQDPIQWEYSAKKIAPKTYEVHITAMLQSPWHIYSQSTPDGGPVPTEFSFAKNPLIIIDSSTKENGNMIKKHEAVFGIDVRYYEGRVDFVQTARLKTAARTNLSGTIKYMLCNDSQCLAPKTVAFIVPLQ